MRKRNHYVMVRMSDDELQRFRSQVSKSGLSQEAFIRKLLNGYQIKEFPPMEYRELIRQLCAIGNSLNQVAVKANSLHMIDANTYRLNYHQLLDHLLSIQEKLESPEKIQST